MAESVGNLGIVDFNKRIGNVEAIPFDVVEARACEGERTLDTFSWGIDEDAIRTAM